MIEFKNLTKKYGSITAVNKVSLKIGRRERVAIVGPSGSGKTTLLRLLAGFEEPDFGEIFIDGQKVSSQGRVITPPDKRRLGMIFQDLALWPHMTVRENLEFGLKSQGLKKAQRIEKIQDVLRIVKLDGHLNRYPQSLSEGEKQRVALARTIVLGPEIMLMDEPLSSLDTLLKEELQEMIVELVRRLNIVLIYVTHDREEAFAVATQIVVMCKGQIEQIGSIEDLSERPKTEFVKRFVRQR